MTAAFVQEDSDVIYIPPDYEPQPDETNTMDQVPYLWDLVESRVKELWEMGITGKGVNVAVMDTGYSPHIALPDPIFTKSLVGESITDGNKHGSWCNGRTVGREGVGMAPEANLIHIKVLSNRGSGRTDWSMDGRVIAAKEGAHITSVSIGGGCMSNNDVPNSMKDANRYGTLLECDAAGNSGFNGNQNTIDCPGKYSTGFAVGAYREDGRISQFSSGGRQLDVACPGENVKSTSNNGSSYFSSSGTSMATPFFAGIMALLVDKRRQMGVADDDMTGADTWRNFFLQEGLVDVGFEDAGAPGVDPSYGIGKPMILKIVNWIGDFERI